MAKRYPNQRPSDFVDGLDSWQAFQLDSALAVKFHTREVELEQSRHIELLANLDNIVRVWGAKLPKRKPIKSLIKKYEDDTVKQEEELPLVDDVLRSLGASGVNVIKFHKKKDG